MSIFTGVFPVYNLQFKINTTPGTTPGTLVTIKDMETFGLSIEGNVEEWSPFDAEGWRRALMTGKSFNVSLNGKRHVGDAGNDFVANTAWKDGLDCSTDAAIEFPDGSKLEFACVLNVTNVAGGDSTNVAPLEFEMIGDGKPTFTAAPQA